MIQAALYETPEGGMLIVNEQAGLAWRLGDCAFPGKALADLKRAAAGQMPRWAVGARPAPMVSGPDTAELTLTARLPDGIYTVYLETAGPAGRTYLGIND